MNTIVRLDKIKATAHIVNVEMEADLQNGRVVELGALLEDGEGYAGVVPADVTAGRLVLHVSVPMGFDEPTFEGDLLLKAGDKGRGYILEKGDIVTLTDDAFTVVPTAGTKVVPVIGSDKLTTAVPAGEAIVGVCIAKELLAGRMASVIEIA